MTDCDNSCQTCNEKKLEMPYINTIPGPVNSAKIPGNTKLFYGAIVGLSQREGYCWATDKQLAEMFDASLATINRWLAILEDHGFINRVTENFKIPEKDRVNGQKWKKKRRIYVNGGFISQSYKKNTPFPEDSKKVCETLINEEFLEPLKNEGYKEESLNKKKDISKEISKSPKPDGSSHPPPKSEDSLSSSKKSEFADEAKELCGHLFKKIKENRPEFKTPNLKTWAGEMERLLRIDKRNSTEVRSVINWIFDIDDFWYKNILSPMKLRKQYDKLCIQMQKKKEKKELNALDKLKQKKKFINGVFQV